MWGSISTSAPLARLSATKGMRASARPWPVSGLGDLVGMVK